MAIHIRRAKPQEAEVCWRIRNLAILDQCQTCYPLSAIIAWTPEEMPEGYRQEIIQHPFFVAENAQGELLATGYLDSKTDRVEAIFTLPTAMGQGIASRIVARIKQEAMAQGLTVLTLSSTPNAQAFYAKQGFERVRDDTHFSPSANYAFDCVEMHCRLV